MDHDSLMLVQTIRSCVHLVFALLPVIAAAFAASRLARDKVPAGAAWMLCALYGVSLVMDVVQSSVPIFARMFGERAVAASSLVGCAIDLPLIVLTGVAFLMLKPGTTGAGKATGAA